MSKSAIGLFAFLISVAASPVSAFAASSCIAPSMPIVPVSFAGTPEAEMTEATVQTYLQSVGQYNKCLMEERIALGETITTEQDAELTALEKAESSKARAVAVMFNAAVVALHKAS